MTELVFASNNKNKVKEISELLSGKFRILSLNDINCKDELPETQPALEGNALQKARFIYDKYKMNCFADDTGLEIDALNGRPGVFSARYAGEKKDPEENMDKVLNEMQPHPFFGCKHQVFFANAVKHQRFAVFLF